MTNGIEYALVNRPPAVLEIVATLVCCPFPSPTMVCTVGVERERARRGRRQDRVKYCTLNRLRSSVQVCSTRQPAAPASAANSSSVYLYEASVQMLSPRSNQMSMPETRTS